MEESEQVCCCGVHSWTKFIAWLEIVISVISIIFVIIASIMLLGNGSSNYRQLYRDYGYGIILGVLITGFVMSLLNLFMGIILLKGVKECNARYVKAWLIYLIICVSLNLITQFATMNKETILIELIGMLFGLAIFMFVFRVVWKFKNEIEMDNMVGRGAAYKA